MSGGIPGLGLLAKLGGPWPYVVCFAIGAAVAGAGVYAVASWRIDGLIAERDANARLLDTAVDNANDQASALAQCRRDISGRDDLLRQASEAAEAGRAKEAEYRARLDQAEADNDRLSIERDQRAREADDYRKQNAAGVCRLSPFVRDGYRRMWQHD